MSDSGWLFSVLSCPRDGLHVEKRGDAVACPSGHEYPVVQGVPVMLLDGDPTLWVAEASRVAAKRLDAAPDERYLETLGLNQAERERILDLPPGPIDPVVSMMIGATGGYLYGEEKGRLLSYPIPEIRLPEGRGRRLLDIGCNWGRWSLAAARAGYRPVGLDPSLGAVLTARRVAAQLGLDCDFVCADARYLPFAKGSFDVAFSYSVLQHFSKENVSLTLDALARVLAAGGRVKIQMGNAWGVRSLYHQARRGFREPSGFDVRYWTPGGLLAEFEKRIGPSTLEVDGFLGLGIQPDDARALSAKARVVIGVSEVLRRASQGFPPLVRLADSLYVESRSRIPA